MVESEFNALTRYNLNFIPYRDGDDVRWAIYDAELDQANGRDGTKLLSNIISEEIGNTHTYIEKERMEQLATIYNAKLLFSSNDKHAVEELQTLLGPDIKVYKYLELFGFSKGRRHGFSLIEEGVAQDVPEEQPIEISPSKKGGGREKPLTDIEHWETSETLRLLRATLVQKLMQIEENVKGGYKETASDILAFGMTVAAPNFPSIVTSLSGIGSMLAMGISAYKDHEDLKEILKDYARFINDWENPKVSKKKALENLKQHMHESLFSYRDIDVSHFDGEDFKKRESQIKAFAHAYGYFDASKPIDADQVLSVGARIRQTSKPIAQQIGKRLVQAKFVGKMGSTAIEELVTDVQHFLDRNDGTKRKEMLEVIASAGKITARDFKNRPKQKEFLREEEKKKELTDKVLSGVKSDFSLITKDHGRNFGVQSDKIRTKPTIIKAAFDIGEFETHKEILKKLPGIRCEKTISEANFTNVSAAMGPQVSGVIYGALSLDPLTVLNNLYGIVMGIGAYAQTAVNVVKAQKTLEGELVKEAKTHEYVSKITRTRLQENYMQQHEGETWGNNDLGLG